MRRREAGLILSSSGSGNVPAPEISLPAEPENLSRLLEFLEEHLEIRGASERAKKQIAVAAEEVFVNIANYAYHPDSGSVTISCSFPPDQIPRIEVRFSDSGKPFNPLEHSDPDITLAASERSIGGLGILMLRKLMDSVRYEYRDGKNILEFRKDLV